MALTTTLLPGTDAADLGRARRRTGYASLRHSRVATLSAPRTTWLIAMGQRVSDAACFVLAAALLGGQLTAAPALAGAALWVGVFSASGLYRPGRLTGHGEMGRVLKAVGVGSGAVLLLGLIDMQPGPSQWLTLGGFLLALEVASRETWRLGVGRLRTGRHLALRTLVVGDGSVLGSDAGLDGWFTCVGVLDGSASRIGTDALAASIDRTGAECVLVAGDVAQERVTEAVRVARGRSLPMYVIAAGTSLLPQNAVMEPVGAATAVCVPPPGQTVVPFRAKRALDIVVSGLALIVLSPFLLLVGAGILVTSGRPVLFRQVRTTEGGRVFRLFKFRSMPNRTTIDLDVEQHVPYFKDRDANEVTRLGGLLRRTSIDELPQLWNVLVGHMSLVGPRPLPLDQVLANPEWLESRHDVPAGLTGWWQVNGRSDLSPEESCRLDAFYIENRSLGLDLYILFRTVGAVLTRRGAV